VKIEKAVILVKLDTDDRLRQVVLANDGMSSLIALLPMFAGKEIKILEKPIDTITLSSIQKEG
jgi:hypothetical protein